MSVGKHFIVDAYLKKETFLKISDLNYETFNKFILDALKNNNMNVISHKLHDFKDPIGGFTALYLLSESHLSFHSFPELNYIAIDCFTCGKCDTQNLVNDIIKYLEPIKYNSIDIDRNNDLLINDKKLVQNAGMSKANQIIPNITIKENKNIFNILYNNHKLLEEYNSKYQNIKITDHQDMGKTLFLDNCLQVCEADIKPYNDGLSKKMFDYFKKNKLNNLELLIIGGGEGFLAEHLLKRYDNLIKSITIVDLDKDVTQLVNKHFRNNKNIFENNNKVSIKYDYGEKYIEKTNKKFDGVIIDCTDFNPKLPSIGLFKTSFYNDVYKKLKPKGYMTQQFNTIDMYCKDKKVEYPKINIWNNKKKFITTNTFSYGNPLYFLHIKKFLNKLK